MWKISMVLMLRALIGDLDSSKYTDSRLRQILAVGAYSLLTDADFSTDYSVDVAQVSITPDPVFNDDADFVVLTVYRSACLLLGSEVKTESGNAISIKDGPSTVDLRGVAGSLMMLYRDVCTKYDDMLNSYQYNNTSVGQAILGPYSPGSWSVGSSINAYYNYHLR